MILDTLARALLPDPVVRLLDTAAELPHATAAAHAEWAAGRGPLAALQAFASHTTRPEDDAAVQYVAEALRAALSACEAACAVGARVSEYETHVRSAVDGALRVTFGVAYQAAATRDVLRRWLAEPQQ